MTRRVASLMNGAYNFIIFMYQMAYGYHFSHSNAHITAISSFTPSSTACPVGFQFLPWKRGGSALRSSTTTYCGMLFRVRLIVHSCSHSLQHFSHVIHPSIARKRTGDAEIGWRPTPEKNIETVPCWGKNSPENCLVDLGRDTRTSTQSR